MNGDAEAIAYEIKALRDQIDRLQATLDNMERDLAGITQAVTSLRDVIADFLSNLCD